MTANEQLGLLYCSAAVGFLTARQLHKYRWFREELPILILRQKLRVL